MKNYGVLKARAKDYQRDADSSPHSELLVEVGGKLSRIAINVRSDRGSQEKRLVEYVVIDDLHHPVVDRARELPLGWSNLRDGNADGAAIDYIRSNMFRAADMKPLVHDAPGPSNDLFEKVEALVQRAISDETALVYAFGESWGPESKPDEYFEFKPGQGVHDIHMNQGEGDSDNAKFQDGALLIDFRAAGAVSGLFIKFQSQAWHTDETTANPLPGAPAGPVIEVPTTGPITPWDPVPVDSPYRLAKIVGALVNPFGADQRQELVTILNTHDRALDLSGWKILDGRDHAETLSGVIRVGEARTIPLTGNGAQLSNKGDTITLLDARGLKVDGVAYTKAAATREGAAIAF